MFFKEFLYLDTVDSTNEYLKRVESIERTIVWTYNQIKGRGRENKKWFDFKDKNLALSMLFIPKEFLNILPPIKKKNCLLLLKELSDNNRQLKLLLDQREEIEKKYKLEKDPLISITDIACPGVVITIKHYKMQIEKAMQNTKFYEDKETKRIIFSSAV